MRALLTLGLIGAIGYATNGTAQPAETAFTPSEQIEGVHSVVVDEPQAIALPQGSGEIWDLLKSSGQVVDTVPPHQLEPNALDFLKVSSAALIRSGPSLTAEIVGICSSWDFSTGRSAILRMGADHRSVVLGDGMDPCEGIGAVCDTVNTSRRRSGVIDLRLSLPVGLVVKLSVQRRSAPSTRSLASTTALAGSPA